LRPGKERVGLWVRVVFGLLPATVVLVPLLFASGLGAAIALAALLAEAGHSAAERWATVAQTSRILVWLAASGAGMVALWTVTLAGAARMRKAPARWWLVAGLLAGVIAATSWLWRMFARGHSDSAMTSAVWLAILVGPLTLAGYYIYLLFSFERDSRSDDRAAI
jgi:hypothetical protein